MLGGVKVKRWMLVVVWFVLQFLWNLLTKTGVDHFFLEKCLIAVEYMAAPIQIIASAIALIVIWKQPWKKKPAPEQQDL